MTTYTWKINSLSVMNVPEDNTAVMSNFTILGEDDSVTGSVTYSVNLLPADVNNFTPFTDITQEMAMSAAHMLGYDSDNFPSKAYMMAKKQRLSRLQQRSTRHN